MGGAGGDITGTLSKAEVQPIDNEPIEFGTSLVGTILFDGTDLIIATSSGDIVINPDGNTVLNDDQLLALGSATDYTMAWNTTQASGGAAFHGISGSKNFIFSEHANRATDHALVGQDNTTLNIFSVDPGRLTQYLKLAYRPTIVLTGTGKGTPATNVGKIVTGGTSGATMRVTSTTATTMTGDRLQGTFDISGGGETVEDDGNADGLISIAAVADFTHARIETPVGNLRLVPGSGGHVQIPLGKRIEFSADPGSSSSTDATHPYIVAPNENTIQLSANGNAATHIFSGARYQMLNDTQLTLGSLFETTKRYDTGQDFNTLQQTVGADSNTYLLCEEADQATNFHGGIEADPTFRVQSGDATNPDQAFRISHNRKHGTLRTSGAQAGVAFNPNTLSDGFVVYPTAVASTASSVQTTLITLTLEDVNIYHVDTYVVGVATDGSERATFKFDTSVFRTGAGSATLQGTPTFSHRERSDGAIDATATVSGSNLLISVTGLPGKPFEWAGVNKVLNSSES